VFLVVIVRLLLWVNPTKSHMEKDLKVAEACVMVLYAQPRMGKMAVDRNWEVNKES
jgi:hypothetical protein